MDWQRDLHFQTRTTIDTLDYSGSGFNEGSKVVVAARGEPRFELESNLPDSLQLPESVTSPRIPLPGVLAIEGPKFHTESDFVSSFCNECKGKPVIHKFRLIVIVDDSDFVARSINNFLWVVFTRSNPATDIDGVDSFTESKHWGCHGPLVIDARIKPHHAPPLVEDSEVTGKVDSIAASGHELSKYL